MNIWEKLISGVSIITDLIYFIRTKRLGSFPASLIILNNEGHEAHEKNIYLRSVKILVIMTIMTILSFRPSGIIAVACFSYIDNCKDVCDAARKAIFNPPP